MARPRRKYPKPFLTKRKNSFILRWYFQNALYEITLGNIDKDSAEHIRSATAVALADRDDFPEEIGHEPTLRRYIAHKNNVQTLSSDDELILQYAGHLKTKSPKSNWHSIAKSHLEMALKYIGTLQNATSGELRLFLDYKASTTSPQTSNRAHTALSGFYRYLRTRGIHLKTYKPLEPVEKMREESREDGIIIWEKGEVPRLLNAANTRRDGIAVWIAVLAGLRRAEVAELTWANVSDAYLLIVKSKTKKKRQVPLSKKLREKLKTTPRLGPRVVPWPEKFGGWSSAARKMTELYLPRFLPDIYDKHPEKFAWNPFRHTFASRLAQEGLSIDIIAAWLGDSPKV